MLCSFIFFLIIAFFSGRVDQFIINTDRHILSQPLYGVPRLFGWVMDTVPFVTRTLASYKQAKNVDSLYLDMNGIYHPATHGNIPFPLNIGEIQRIKRIFAAIAKIYSIIKPKKLLFLGSDGVCPAAKIKQQRTRRNRSNLEALKVRFNPEIAERIQIQMDSLIGLNENQDKIKFTPNMISPGTEFVTTVENELKKWISLNVSAGFFGDCQVVFSGADVPGEGEHKIFQSIRRNKHQSAVVYGLDADLMLLASLIQNTRCVILREKRHYTPHVVARTKPNPFYDKARDLVHFHKRDFLTLEKRHFEVVDLKPIATHFYNRISTKNKCKFIIKGKDDETINSLARDFVFLTFLAGNDFLPRVPAVDLADESFTPFLLTYFSNFHKIGGFITNSDTYSITRFKRFLKYAKGMEKDWFRVRGLKLGIDEFLTDDYKKYYYKIKFGVDFDEQPSFIKKVVNDYLTGLKWNIKYYNKSQSCWNWWYGHHYAPLLTDLYKSKYQEYEFPASKPVSQLGHLLSVCPPEDNHLLPEQLRGIEEVEKYFPQDVEIDEDGYSNDWEYVVKMPFIDPKRVEKIVSERLAKSPLCTVDRERNAKSEIRKVMSVHLTHFETNDSQHNERIESGLCAAMEAVQSVADFIEAARTEVSNSVVKKWKSTHEELESKLKCVITKHTYDCAKEASSQARTPTNAVADAIQEAEIAELGMSIDGMQSLAAAVNKEIYSQKDMLTALEEKIDASNSFIGSIANNASVFLRTKDPSLLRLIFYLVCICCILIFILLAY